MSERVAFTEPLTISERIDVRWYGIKLDTRKFFREGLWRWIAHHLPERVVYFAYFRILAHAWAAEGNKHPDELTMKEVSELWEARS